MSPVWCRDPRVLWRRSGQRAVLLTPQRSDHLLITGSGSVIWELLGEPITQPTLTDEVASRFGVDPHAVAPEIDDFLEDLLAIGAVRRW